jgi:hypothetical protein
MVGKDDEKYYYIEGVCACVRERKTTIDSVCASRKTRLQRKEKEGGDELWISCCTLRVVHAFFAAFRIVVAFLFPF